MESELDRLRAQVVSGRSAIDNLTAQHASYHNTVQRTFQNQFNKEQQTNRELSLRLKAAKDDAAAARAEAQELRERAGRVQDSITPTTAHARRVSSGSFSGAADDKVTPGLAQLVRKMSASPSNDADSRYLSAELRRLEAEVAGFRRIFAAMACGKSLHDAIRWEVSFSRIEDTVKDFVKDLGLESALKPLPSLLRQRVPLADLFVIVGPGFEEIVDHVHHVEQENRKKAASKRSGAKSSDSKQSGKTSVILEPEVLYHTPTDAQIPSGMLADFCYPAGIQLKTYEPGPVFDEDSKEVQLQRIGEALLLGKHGGRRGPRSHMFVLTGSDQEDAEQTVVAAAAAARGTPVEARTRYCLCLQIFEPLSRSLLLGYANKAHLAQSPADISVPLDASPSDVVVLVPRTLCLVSRYPFFALHFEFLRAVAQLWRAQKFEDIMHLKQAGYAEAIFNPAPIKSPEAAAPTHEVRPAERAGSLDVASPPAVPSTSTSTGALPAAAAQETMPDPGAAQNPFSPGYRSKSASSGGEEAFAAVHSESGVSRSLSTDAATSGGKQSVASSMANMWKSAIKNLTPSDKAAQKAAPPPITAPAENRNVDKTSLTSFLSMLSPAANKPQAANNDALQQHEPPSNRNTSASFSQFFGLGKRQQSESISAASDDGESPAFTENLISEDVKAAACAVLSTAMMWPALIETVHNYLLLDVPRHSSKLLVPFPLLNLKSFAATSPSTVWTRDTSSGWTLSFTRALPAPTHFTHEADGVTEVGSTAALLSQLEDDFAEMEAFRGKARLPNANHHSRLATCILRAGTMPSLQDLEACPVPPYQLGCNLENAETLGAIREWAAPLLFSLLPLDSLMLIIGAALTEQKIIVVGGQVSQEATACCVIALAALLQPLSWVGPFLPVVPALLNDVLNAPLPILVGVPHLPEDYDQDEQTVLVLLDKEAVRVPAVKTMESDGTHESVHLLPGFLEIQLPDNSVLYHRLEPVSRFLRIGSGSGSGKVIGKDHVNPKYKPTAAQIAAADALSTAINSHIHRLLSRLLTAGIASNETKTTVYPDDLTAAGNQIARLVPPLSTCVASMLETVPEVEAPFWSRFCSSQMLSYFYDSKLQALQAAALLTPVTVAPSDAAVSTTDVSSAAMESPPLSESLTAEQRAKLAAARKAARDARLAARQSAETASSFRRMSSAIDMHRVTLGPASLTSLTNTSVPAESPEPFGFPTNVMSNVAAGTRSTMRRSTMAWAPGTTHIASATVAIRSRESLGPGVTPPPPPPHHSSADVEPPKGIRNTGASRRHLSGIISPPNAANAAVSTAPSALPPLPSRTPRESIIQQTSSGEHPRARVASSATGVINSDDEGDYTGRERSVTPFADAVLDADAPLDIVAQDVKQGMVARRSTIFHARRNSNVNGNNGNS